MEDTKNMNCIDIKKKIKVFIIENFLLGDSSNNLNDEDSFFEKGIIYSTGVLELVSFVEKSFNVKFEDEELIPDNLDSINKVSDFILKKTST